MPPSQSETGEPFWEGDPVPANSLCRGHLDDCMAIPIYNLVDHDPVTHILRCAEGCVRLERARERGREVAKEHGW